MISCMVYDPKKEELESFKEILHREAAYQSADEWKMEFLEKTASLQAFLKRQDNTDIICLDITPAGILKILEKLRECYKETKLLLIADAAISPMAYLRPGIRPDALLLRPCDKPKIREVVQELLQVYMKQLRLPDTKESFAVEARGGKTLLSYEKILYFESREKKIYVRAARQEYGFYDTMEHLLEILPDHFVRCHRSYIVNKWKVKKVVLSQNYIEMTNAEMIPISRSYRTEVKNL